MDAAGWKAKGNEFFSAKQFDEAVEAFSKAIELDASNHVLYSNRSASYASLNNYDAARDDAAKCVELNPNWAKGYVRLGSALHGLKDYEKAKETYEAGLKVDGANESLKSGLADVEKDAAAAEAGDAAGQMAKLFGPDPLAKARASPKLAPYCAQQDYVQILTLIGKNPAMAQNFMKDQRIMHTLLEFSGIDMGQFSQQQAPPQPAPEQPKPAAAPSKPKPAPKPAPETTPALKLKEEGNALYKQRKFDEALAKYQEAAALEPENTVFLLNQTAVIFEQEKYDECIAKCDSAIEHGKEHKADFSVIAKLMTRKASCLQKKQQFDDAIELYNKALLENRNAETQTKLDACKKAKKEAEATAYFSEEKSLEAKTEGNEHFKANRYPEAIKCYDEAQKRNPKDHTVYSNRAAALLKMMAYEDAIRDCDKCIEINPEFPKAYIRRGHAYFWTKQYNKALKEYEEALKHDAQNVEAQESRQRTMMKIQEMVQGEGDEEAASRAMADPEIQQILQDSYMQLVLSEMQKDPKKINDYMKDPSISAKINKLIMAGVLRVGNGPQGGQQQQRRR